MSWAVVARKDFQDSIRSRWLIGLSVVFVLLVTLTAAGVSWLFGDLSSSGVLFAINGTIITTLVPLLALAVSFSAVSGERASGSLKLLLALPHSREDVVLGKFLGRSSAAALAVAVGFLLPGLVLAAISPFEPLMYLGYVLWVCLLSAMFVAIGTGISAWATTQWRATALMLGYYFLFVIFWQLIQLATGFVMFLLLDQKWPTWLPWSVKEVQLGLRVANPTGAFKILTSMFLAGKLFAVDVAQGYTLTTRISAVLMVLFWVLAPLTLGLWRFGNADL